MPSFGLLSAGRERSIDLAVIARDLAATPYQPTLPRRIWEPRLGIFLLFAGLFLAAGLVSSSYLAYRGSVATMGYSLQRLEAESASWKSKNDQLRAELARLKSLAFIEHEATQRLQMQRPRGLTYLRIEQLTAPAAPPGQLGAFPSAERP